MVKRDAVDVTAAGQLKRKRNVMIKMIIDFIKSWFYYPKMTKYLKDKCNIEYPCSRLRYSWWHCRIVLELEKTFS